MATYSEILDAEVSAEAPITVSLMTRLRDNALSYLGAPTGTRAVFHQTDAPLGWTKSATHNDKALRVVSGTVGSGGSLGFTTVFSRTATDSHIITVAEMPVHAHDAVTGIQLQNHTHKPSAALNGKRYIDSTGGAGNIVASILDGGAHTQVGTSFFSNPLTEFENENITHSIPSNGGSIGHTHGNNMQVQYMDVTVSVKD